MHPHTAEPLPSRRRPRSRRAARLWRALTLLVTRPFPVAVLTLVGLLACDGGSPPGDGAVRDSADLHIVEHAAGGGEVIWTVGPEPLVDIGRAEGETPYLLQDVPDATRLVDGGFAVLDRAAGEVRVFDRNGSHVRTLGRRGEGPGEFRSPLRVWQRGDSLVVFDWNGGRITLLPMDGSTPRIVTPVGLARAYDADVWLAGDRVIVPVKTPAPPMDRTGPVEVSVSYVAVPLDGTPPDTVASIGAGLQKRMEFTVAGRTMITADVSPALLQALPRAAAGDGYLWAGSGRRPGVRRFDLRGEPDMEVRWNAPGTAADEALVERYIEDRAAASDDPRGVRETLRQIPVADSLPYYDGLMMDGGGRLWVRGFQVASGDGLERWTVYGPEGARIARARVPRDLTVFRVGEGWILGLRRGELDVPHVVLLPVSPLPPPR